MKTIRVVLGLAALGLAGCGGYSTSPGPSPSPTPAPVRTVLFARSFSVSAGATFSDTVDNVPAGTIDARLDWGSAGADLNLYVTDTACASILQILAGACRVLGQAIGTAKPEVVSFSAATTANYVVWARSLAAGSEAATVELAVTR